MNVVQIGPYRSAVQNYALSGRYAAQGKSVSNPDGFSRSNPSFGVLHYKWYEDNINEVAKRYVDKKDDAWIQNLYDEYLVRGCGWERADKYEKASERLLFDLMFFGGYEYMRADMKKSDKEDANNYVRRVSNLVYGMRKEKLEAALAEKEAQRAAAQERLDIENSLATPKSVFLKSFSDKVDAEMRNVKVEIPNAIMLINEDSNLTNMFKQWMVHEADCNFTSVPNIHDEDKFVVNIASKLEEAQKQYENNGVRTLLFIEGFEKLINIDSPSFEVVEGFKDILCRTASDFGTTIMFETKNPANLVQEIIQPHRVGTRIRIAMKHSV